MMTSNSVTVSHITNILTLFSHFLIGGIEKNEDESAGLSIGNQEEDVITI
jgi:hypothetical protein